MSERWSAQWLIGTGLSLVVGGCASSSATQTRSPRTPAQLQLPQLRVGQLEAPRFTDPERRAKLSSAFPKISRAVAELRELEGVPGIAIGVVIDGELAYLRAFGEADRDSGRALETDTRFRIGSLTKVFTALALLRQRDAGVLELDAPVVSVLPELGGLVYPSADSRAITFADLLTHSSGLPRLGYLPYWESERGPSEAELLASLDGFALEAAPGVAYSYSNLGFGLLGAALGRVVGQSVETHIERALLEPLEMKATVWKARKVPRDRRATAYELGPAGELVVAPDWSMGAMSAAGGLYSTVEDLARFAAWQLDAWPPRSTSEDPILARASSREAQTPRFAHGSGGFGPRGVGWGWQGYHECFGRVVGHSGGTEGFKAKLDMLPEHGVAVIVLLNSSAVNPGVFSKRALNLLYASGGLVARESVAAPELHEAAAALLALLADFQPAGYETLFAPILRRERELAEHEAQLRWWHAQLGDCELGEMLATGAANAGRYALNCAGGEAALELRVQLGQPEALVHYELRAKGVDASAEVRALAEAASALLAQWNEHGFEQSFASKWSAEGIRGFLQRVNDSRGACSLGEELVVGGAQRATFSLDCERGSMAMMVLASEGEAPRIEALEIRSRKQTGPCGELLPD